jgi:hypothetical protein
LEWSDLYFVKGKVRLTKDLRDRKRIARLCVVLCVVLSVEEDRSAQVVATSIEGGEMRQNRSFVKSRRPRVQKSVSSSPTFGLRARPRASAR